MLTRFAARCDPPLILTRQAAHPLLELPVKGSRAIESTPAINFRQRVVLLVEQLQRFLYAVARKEMMKSRAGETAQEAVEMVRTGAAVPGRVHKPDVGICIRLFDERPKPLQPARVDAPAAYFR